MTLPPVPRRDPAMRDRSSRCFPRAVLPAAAATLLAVGAPALAEVPSSSASGLTTLHAAAWDTSDPRRVCQDFFCSTFILVPPERVDRDKTTEMPVFFSPTVVQPDAERRAESVSAPLGGASGNASAKLAIGATSVDFGVAATAAKSSVFVGEARAALRTEYSVRVQLRTRDLLGALTAAACANGCTLAMDFLHQTTGRFAYGFQPGAEARASFEEVLRIDGIVQASGEAFIAADPSAGNGLAPGATGDWSASDFILQRADSAGSEWTFNHFTQITDQRATFFPSDQLDENGNVVFSGRYVITVDQVAEAGFGRFEYIVGTATLAADFDDTSSFTPGRLYDPAGVLDLSGAQVDVSFASAASVPEPSTWAMFAAGMGLALRRVRGRVA